MRRTSGDPSKRIVIQMAPSKRKPLLSTSCWPQAQTRSKTAIKKNIINNYKTNSSKNENKYNTRTREEEQEEEVSKPIKN